MSWFNFWIKTIQSSRRWNIVLEVVNGFLFYSESYSSRGLSGYGGSKFHLEWCIMCTLEWIWFCFLDLNSYFSQKMFFLSKWAPESITWCHKKWNKIHSVVVLTYLWVTKWSWNKLNLSHLGSRTLSIGPTKDSSESLTAPSSSPPFFPQIAEHSSSFFSTSSHPPLTLWMYWWYCDAGWSWVKRRGLRASRTKRLLMNLQHSSWLSLRAPHSY